jgi:PAS domain S-box-containing protein
LAARVLAEGGIECALAGSMAELTSAVESGADAVLLAEEALAEHGLRPLALALARQSAWSALPILVLTRPGAASSIVRDAIAELGNVTLLERPTAMSELLSAVRSALRARKQQYELRDQMEALSQRERELQDFFENAAVGLHLIDARGVILRANKTELALLGYSADEYVGRPIADFHVDQEVVADLLARLLSGETIDNCDARLRAKDGSIKYVLLSSNSLFEDGHFIHARCFTRDITLRRRAEEALRVADRHKDEFLAMLAHELRNPLGPIRHAVDIWRLNQAHDPALGQLRDVIDRQVSHLTHLVDDLLDVSRINSGKVVLRREIIDFGALVRRVVDDRAGPLAASRLAVRTEIPARPMWVHADPTRLEQCISNLLQNAQKFTDPGGRVSVRLRRDAESAVARLSVSDTGIGMEPETVAHLFQPFIQADRTLDRSRGGLGLGLALVRGIVELHGGSVHAQSAGPGLGATLSVALPLAKPPRGMPPAQASPARQDALRVLVVDDRRDATLTLCTLLSALGHQVESASTAEEGLEIARRWHPEAIISDIGLPGHDGYEFARWTREDPDLRDALLIALTGYGRPEDHVKAVAAGFDFHLTKPAGLSDLQRVLGRA